MSLQKKIVSASDEIDEQLLFYSIVVLEPMVNGYIFDMKVFFLFVAK